MAATIILLLAGCRSSAPTMRDAFESFMIPEIGSITTKGVGENLVTQGTGKLEPFLVISEDSMIGTVPVRKGQYAYNDENSTRIQFERDGENDLYLYKEGRKICLSKTECAGPTLKYTLKNRLASKFYNSFQQTLLYNGKIGNKITLGYREFKNDMARSAFSNDVSYDLSESVIVGYKGARIEIIKATNTDLTYRFLSGFKN